MIKSVFSAALVATVSKAAELEHGLGATSANVWSSGSDWKPKCSCKRKSLPNIHSSSIGRSYLTKSRPSIYSSKSSYTRKASPSIYSSKVSYAKKAAPIVLRRSKSSYKKKELPIG